MPPEIEAGLDLRQPWMDFYLIAHDHLSTEKTSSYIPWSAMSRYADRYGMDEEFFEHFVSAMLAIDAKFIEMHEKEQKEKKKLDEKKISKQKQK